MREQISMVRQTQLPDPERPLTNRPERSRPGERKVRLIRMVIADDHAILRQSLQRVLSSCGEIEVVAEAADGREAVSAVEKLQPDIVLMDMAMPGLSGLEATRQIRKRFKRTRVIMLTALMEEEHIIAALRAGASGFLVKSSDIEELLHGIRTVQAGNTYFSSAVTDVAHIHQHHWLIKFGEAKSGFELLTSREREVLQLIGEGDQNRRIGADLGISVKTVEVHKDHIMKKVGARTRGDLIRYALRRGLVSLDRPVTNDLMVASESSA